MRTSWIPVCASLLLAAACGATSPGPDGPVDIDPNAVTGMPVARNKPAGDLAFAVAPSQLSGTVFAPHALGRPGIPTVKAKGDNGKTTPTDAQIDKATKSLASEKNGQIKEADAEILASLYYRQSDAATDPATQTKLINQARQTLVDFTTAAGDKTEDQTWWMLASYQLLAEDYAGSEKSWAAAVNKGPTDANAPMWRAWWAYVLLREGKPADALAVVKDQTLSDKQPELAYVTAWVKWINNDDAGAWQAIATAVAGWPKGPSHDTVLQDAILIAARSNSVSPDDALPRLLKVWGGGPNDKVEVLGKLGLAGYRYAGRWNDAIATDDKLATAPGTPVNLVVSARFGQAEATTRLDKPDAVANYAKQAVDALASCPAPKCSADDASHVLGGIQGIAARFHQVFTTAVDPRYYDAAHALYGDVSAVSTDPKLKDQATSYSANLDKTKKNVKVGNGVHDPDATGWLIKQHDQEVQACYEQVLAGNNKLTGAITVNLEADASGAVKGVSTEPAGGVADLAAVAGCAGEHAKTWKLPKRGEAGTSRIKLTYQLSPKSATKS